MEINNNYPAKANHSGKSATNRNNWGCYKRGLEGELTEVVETLWQEVSMDCLFRGLRSHGKLLVAFFYLKGAINIHPLYYFPAGWTDLARCSAAHPAQPHSVLSLTGGAPASD